MKQAICVLSGILLLSGGAVWGAPLSMVKVTGQRVNMRAKPNPQAEVVGQIDEGEFLLVKSFSDEWVEIVPPDSIDLWVHKEFIVDKMVTASTLNVRAGAGIAYSIVGVLAKGDQIQPRGDFGDWIRIAPPNGCSLWVSRSLVQTYTPGQSTPAPASTGTVSDASADQGNAAQPAASASAAARPKLSVPPVTAESVPRPPPTDLDLIPLDGQGKTVQKEGVLRPAGFVIGRPAPFRLVREKDGVTDTVCFVRGNREQLTSFLNQRMAIRGRQYWVQGLRYPVIIPDQIVPSLEP